MLTGVMIWLFCPVNAQKLLSQADTSVNNRLMITAFDLKPQVLAQSDLMVRLNLTLPGYFKTRNLLTGKMEKLSDKVVLNEMTAAATVDYGLTPRLTLYAQVPVSDIHHYSPMGEVSGKGFSDIGIGGYYNLAGNALSKNEFTANLSLFLPTGQNKNLTPAEYPLGMGVVRVKGALTGLYRMANSTLLYSGYYEFRPKNSSGVNLGDNMGLTLMKENYFNTSYGNFGLEYGVFSSYTMYDKKSGTKIIHSSDFSAGAFAGGFFEYLNKLYLRFDLPYNVYQDGAFFTKYVVMVQLDYRFSL